MTTAASLGVATGVLIAPQSGKKTRADIKKAVVKSVEAIGNALPNAPNININNSMHP